MTLAVALANLALGCIYTGYGVMTIIDMKRGWRTMGFSHFGAAWIAMAFTCGPHHLDHGAHLLLAHSPATSLDLAAVLVGAPAGLTWFLLRIEAFRGGPGDRRIPDTPWWLKALPTMAGVYVTALLAIYMYALRTTHRYTALGAPTLSLVLLYSMVGFYLARTQMRNRGSVPGWSLSGISLAIVFPTCALMHLTHAIYASAGTYDVTTLGLTIDWLSVPAAMYFLWVVRALYRESLVDWNHPAEVYAGAR